MSDRQYEFCLFRSTGDLTAVSSYSRLGPADSHRETLGLDQVWHEGLELKLFWSGVHPAFIGNFMFPPQENRSRPSRWGTVSVLVFSRVPYLLLPAYLTSTYNPIHCFADDANPMIFVLFHHSRSHYQHRLKSYRSQCITCSRFRTNLCSGFY